MALKYEDPTDLTLEVEHQTRMVFENFVIEKLEHDDLSEIYNLSTPTNLSEDKKEKYRQIGRILARVGIDLYQEKLELFKKLERLFDLSNDNIAEIFPVIVKSMLKEGPMNLGKILLLFCFGYYLIERFLSFENIFKIIQDCVIHFVRDYIAQWIISQGGWSYVAEAAREHFTDHRTHYLSTLGVVGGIACCVLGAIYFLRKNA